MVNRPSQPPVSKFTLNCRTNLPFSVDLFIDIAVVGSLNEK